MATLTATATATARARAAATGESSGLPAWLPDRPLPHPLAVAVPEDDSPSQTQSESEDEDEVVEKGREREREREEGKAQARQSAQSVSYQHEMLLESKVLPYLRSEQLRIESSIVPAGPLNKEMAIALGLPSGNVDILRHRSAQRDAMPDWKLFQLFDQPPDPKNFKARLSYTKMDAKQSSHMNALHRLVYGKTAEECGRKVCKEYARAYAIEMCKPCTLRLDWAQFAVDKRGKRAQRRQEALPPQVLAQVALVAKEADFERPRELDGEPQERQRLPLEMLPMDDSRQFRLQRAKRLLGFQPASPR